jgi:hypothetical protein
MMEGLGSKGTDKKTIMIDATYLKVHRTASSLRAIKRALDWAGQGRVEHQAACRHGYQRLSTEVLHDRRPGQRLH